MGLMLNPEEGPDLVLALSAKPSLLRAPCTNQGPTQDTARLALIKHSEAWADATTI